MRSNLQSYLWRCHTNSVKLKPNTIFPQLLISINIQYIQSKYLRLITLESMSLIHNKHLPVNTAQQSHVIGDQLIRGQQYVELHL